MSKIVKFIYNSKEDLEKFQKLNLKNYQVEIYNESINKERKKAFMIKSSCGAAKIPFICIYKDNSLFKAFYQESGDSIDNFKKYLLGIKNPDKKMFKDFVIKCKNLDLTYNETINYLKEYYEQN